MVSESDVKSMNDYKYEHFRLLLIGDSGAGKTTLASTAPGKIFWFMFEDGLQSVAKKAEFRDRTDFIDCRSIPYDPKRCKEPFIRAMSQLKVLMAEADKYNVVVVDSLLSLTECVMDYVKALAGKAGQPLIPEKGEDARPLYSALADYTWYFIKGLHSLPMMHILTAHESLSQNEVTGAKELGMCTIGQAVAKRLPKEYSEVWRIVKKYPNDGKKAEFRVQTDGDGLFKPKSRYGCFDQWEIPDLSYLMEKVHKEFGVCK